MLSIIDRLLIREVLKTLLVILVVLLMLILANALVKLLGEVAAGEMSLELMGVFFGVRVIKLVGFITPPAFFFAILWVLGQMYRNSEMVALNAAGIGIFRLYRPFLLVSLLLAAVTGAISLHLYPLAKAHANELVQRERTSVQLGGLKPGGFTEFNDGQFMVYVGDVQGRERLKDLFVRYDRNGRSGVVLAASSRIEQRDDGRFLVLEKGYRYDGEPGTEGFSKGSFRRYGIRLPETRVSLQASSVELLPLPLLLAGDSLKFRTELQWRLAAPLSVFALMLVSVPLARSLPRQGVYGRLIVAVVFYAVYLNLLRLAQDWMRKGVLPDWMGIWWVPASAALVGLLLLYLDTPAVNSRWRRLLPRRS